MANVSHVTAVSKDIASATKSLFIRVSAGALAASIGCPIVGLIFALIFVIIFSQAHGNTTKVSKLTPITGNV
jgi:hypothetical protein